MYAITVILERDGDHEVVPGSLFKSPAEILTISQIKRYLSAPLGWSYCPLDYSVYAAETSDGWKVIAPGIICLDKYKRPRRKFPNYPIKFQSSQIESFIKRIILDHNRINEQVQSELMSVNHDLRAISAEIHSAADLLRSDLEKKSMIERLIA